MDWENSFNSAYNLCYTFHHLYTVIIYLKEIKNVLFYMKIVLLKFTVLLLYEIRNIVESGMV
jgi:hypothetical protein